MRLFFCPVRPLSRSGQVLLCVVCSIFAALLLVAWSPADAGDCAAPLTSAFAVR
jgi:Ca-activated chloride channel family protein